MIPNPAKTASTRRQALKALGVGIATVGFGTTAGAAETDGADTTTDATVTLDDQSPHFGTVYVSEVVLPDDGFVVLHDAAFFLEGPIVGVSPPLKAGTYENVPIALDEYPDGPMTLSAIPHRDTPSDGTFTFPDDGDEPYVDADGLVYDIGRIQPE